ncbi:nuclear transport factor 2 family protein [Nocardia carnea]|uniref:nuclear transport factor 2 family protein n=1 Tax=Nocardia carnea TaxID=37328 RepID=UPI0024561809|nr:nuclear transport factor 2 family protein [Nocardia carnea]
MDSGEQTHRVANVLFAFARMADEGTIEELGALCTEDVEWQMAGRTWRGRQEVIAGLLSMRAAGHAGPDSGNRHVVTNQEIEVHGGDATARSYFQLVSVDAPAKIAAFGAYRDLLRRTAGDHWLIARREVLTPTYEENR